MILSVGQSINTNINGWNDFLLESFDTIQVEIGWNDGLREFSIPQFQQRRGHVGIAESALPRLNRVSLRKRRN